MEAHFQSRSSVRLPVIPLPVLPLSLPSNALLTGSTFFLLLMMVPTRSAWTAEPVPKANPPIVENAAPEWHSLLGTEFPGAEWVYFSGQKDASFTQTWEVTKDTESGTTILVCKGEPHGYLRTRAEYANFDLRLEWRFPKDPNGNSGILLFTSGEDRIWPAALQIQLHQPELGVVFPIGGAKSANELHPGLKLAKPVNQWNQCEIRCRHGSATVTINGQDVGAVQSCLPALGTIALQSEGSEVHFRAISIREIPIAQATIPEIPTGSSETGPASRR